MPKSGSNLLTELSLKSAKPERKAYLLRDGGGLWLVVEPPGRKWWKLRIVFAKKENSFSLGDYPTVTLASARKKRNEIREQIAAGIDPGASRKIEKTKAAGQDIFEAVARAWHQKSIPRWSAGHAATIKTRLERDIFPVIGSRPIAEITPPEIAKVLQRIEARSIETAHRLRNTCRQIFSFAVATGLVAVNPATDLRAALSPKPPPQHMAAPTDPQAVAEILRILDGYEGSFVVRCALRLAPLIFVRPGELRAMQWADLNLTAAEWRFMVNKTKTPHVVPLSHQALTILEEIQPLTSAGRYVFPSTRSASRPMSNNTVNAAMRRMGIDTRAELTGHGFRAIARTLLDEVLGFRPDFIEHQLAHSVRDPMGRAYNRTAHLEERRTMMQKWADYLDQIKAGKLDNIVYLRSNTGKIG